VLQHIDRFYLSFYLLLFVVVTGEKETQVEKLLSSDFGSGYDLSKSDILSRSDGNEFGVGDPGRTNDAGYIFAPVVNVETAEAQQQVSTDKRFMTGSTKTSSMLESMSDIMESFEVSVSVEAEGDFGFGSAGFSASGSFKEVTQKVSMKSSKTAKTSMRAITAFANLEDRFQVLPLSTVFISSVERVALGTITGEDFLKLFGTHYVWGVGMGCLYEMTLTGTTSFMSDSKNTEAAFSLGVTASGGGYSGAVDVSGGYAKNKSEMESKGMESIQEVQLGGMPTEADCGGSVSPVKLELRSYLPLIQTISSLDANQKRLAVERLTKSLEVYKRKRLQEKESIISGLNIPASSAPKPLEFTSYSYGKFAHCAIRHTIVRGLASEEACEDTCSRDEQCTFANWQPQGANGWCYLMSGDFRNTVSDAPSRSPCITDESAFTKIVPKGKRVKYFEGFSLGAYCPVEPPALVSVINSFAPTNDVWPSYCSQMCEKDSRCNMIGWNLKANGYTNHCVLFQWNSDVTTWKTVVNQGNYNQHLAAKYNCALYGPKAPME
jgi:hypothetical protein